MTSEGFSWRSFAHWICFWEKFLLCTAFFSWKCAMSLTKTPKTCQTRADFLIFQTSKIKPKEVKWSAQSHVALSSKVRIWILFLWFSIPLSSSTYCVSQGLERSLSSQQKENEFNCRFINLRGNAISVGGEHFLSTLMFSPSLSHLDQNQNSKYQNKLNYSFPSVVASVYFEGRSYVLLRFLAGSLEWLSLL